MVGAPSKSSGNVAEDTVEVALFKEIKGELSDIKITGYDNLAMLKKILVELQELVSDLAIMKGQG